VCSTQKHPFTVDSLAGQLHHDEELKGRNDMVPGILHGTNLNAKWIRPDEGARECIKSI
jgi:hypothetical protein